MPEPRLAIHDGRTIIPMTRDMARAFYGIPAMSAGLYPKTPYEERVQMLDALLAHLQFSGNEEFNQVWGWVKAIK